MMNSVIKNRLSNMRLYKFDVPCESDVGVIVVTWLGVGHTGCRFQLSKYTGRGRRRRGSKAGLCKSFVDLVSEDYMMHNNSHIPNQIFDYIVSNFCFKDLEVVPPASPVLVFHFQVTLPGHDYVPQVHISRLALTMLRIRDSVLSFDDAITRVVPIAPPTTEIVDSYQSSELCLLCNEGYPKEDEVVHRTRCNHIFHAACISRYLLHTPQCPLCSAHLPPVDIRTLLFS